MAQNIFSLIYNSVWIFWFKILGIDGAEQAWGNVKTFKTDKRAHFVSKKTKMKSIIYTATKLFQAQTLWTEIEKLAEDRDAILGKEDARYDLGLEKFGVDVQALQEDENNHKCKF